MVKMPKIIYSCNIAQVPIYLNQSYSRKRYGSFFRGSMILRLENISHKSKLIFRLNEQIGKLNLTGNITTLVEL